MIRVATRSGGPLLRAAGYGPLLGRAFDPAHADQGVLITSGALYVSKIHLPWGGLVSTLWTIISTAGATLTADQNWLALYDAAGTRRGVTADQSTAFATAQILGADLVTPYQAPPGDYWVAVLANATTAPTLLSGTLLNKSSASVANAGHTAADGWRFGFHGTGQTVTPATITPASIVPNIGACLWAAAS